MRKRKSHLHQRRKSTYAQECRMFVDTIKIMKGDGTDKLPTYGGSLKEEEVIEWIEAISDYFEMTQVQRKDRVRIAKETLKGVTLSWWNYIQGERIKEGKEMITSWEVLHTKVEN